MELALVINQKVHLKITPKDDAGIAREVKDINWTVLSGDATIEVDADKLGALVIPSDTPGVIIVEVDANADITGAGTKTLTDKATITASAPEATSLGLIADEPVAK